jgi:hypothetical protein
MNHDQRRTDEELVERIRATLDAQTLTPDVGRRLLEARRSAVAAATTTVPRIPAVWWPVGALAAMVLAVVLVRPTPDAAPPLDDVVQLAAAEDMDLLENLEFAAWMVESDSVDAG